MVTGLTSRLLQNADKSTVDFSKLKVENLKKYLSDRGPMQLIDGENEIERRNW